MRNRRRQKTRLKWAATIAVTSAIALADMRASRPAVQEYKASIPLDHPAIRYPTGPVTDRAGALAAQLAGGTRAFSGRSIREVLPEILQALGIRADSQMLVFSKTSLQSAHISPERPRAIYFADDVAVGFASGAGALEIAAQDAVQGTIFYTVATDDGRIDITRRVECVRCHQGPNTAGVPGIYIGSVIPGPTGAPLRDDSAIITDHRSAFDERWGGWYVTARRGEQRDRANAVASNPSEPEALVRESRQNLTHLMGLVDTSGYLAQTSDIVALMTYEHQTQMANLITRVGWLARIAAAEPPGGLTGRTLDSEIEDLVAYMLFEGEPRLPEAIEGVSSFTRTFPQQGPRDRKGRSLRDFDLRTRLFRYPLSYMIYSAAFDGLPSLVRERVYARLRAILTTTERSGRYAYITLENRRAVWEILTGTKPVVCDTASKC